MKCTLFCSCELCLCFSLRSAHEQVEIYKRKLDALDDYERQIRLLRDEVSYLSTEKAMLQERYTCTQHTLQRPYMHTHKKVYQMMMWFFPLRLSQVGEKSFSEPLAQTQSLFQPREERVAHQSSAHQFFPPCTPRIPLQ